MPTGKCPKCEATLNNVNINAIDINEGLRPRFKGVTYTCPYCHTVLGVGVDPFALKNDTVKETLQALRQGRS
ncbi:conserved hypothetical protein [uncultured Alphaproteobacteria bacterium]|uniref:Uncharacterized protein n=1 Tax=uncultured Alphaproteobacteria bacterium TaxID=91750 RepID=A0A212KM01_9PROT|nr:conserved hypothetical protein [uncultured Alphaproteobacteria bacterium]